MSNKTPAQKKTSKVAYVFPGQGSQWVGMGRDLYNDSDVAKAVFDEADEVLGFPLSRLCFEGPEEELRRTVNAQPAILITSIACLKAAEAVKGMKKVGTPGFVAGHSLGEYTALVAADVLDFAQAVTLVRERGWLMEKAGRKQSGGMLAIIGLEQAMVQKICLASGAQIANINSAEQIVISGSKKSLARASDLAQDHGARRVVPLQVSGAFHSGLMEPAIQDMTEAIAQLNFQDPSIPIVANITAQPLTTAEEIKTELITQLCNCVDWRGSVNYMAEAGITTFVEIGPGQVLSGLIKRINPEVQTINIGEPQPGKSVLKWQPASQPKDVKLKGAKAKKDRAWGWMTG